MKHIVLAVGATRHALAPQLQLLYFLMLQYSSTLLVGVPAKLLHCVVAALIALLVPGYFYFLSALVHQQKQPAQVPLAKVAAMTHYGCVGYALHPFLASRQLPCAFWVPHDA